MTSQMNSPVAMSMKSELDQLAYSAFLLILDPTLALSVVKAALDEWPEQVTGPDLLERTVVLSLQELQHYPCLGSDRESSLYDVMLYGGSKVTFPKPFISLEKDMSINPILSLDTGCRIAFVLHHVLGYKLSEAAAKAEVTEKEYHAQLRRAYSQLMSFQSENEIVPSRIPGRAALA